ncbi:hypothetical protein ZWY2020_040638 [Hordeum vulgare]|nr:hypothetical protein ZWY2020_040638 [Hordeum vulgare]
MARREVARSGTGHHGCRWNDNDGRRGEPPCDGPPPWRWSSFSITSSETRLVAPWPRLAAAWSVCRRHRLLALTRKEMTNSARHDRGGGVPPASACESTFAASSSYTRDDSPRSTAGVARTRAHRDTDVQKSGGWFGFIFDAMEVMLKVSVHALEPQLATLCG